MFVVLCFSNTHSFWLIGAKSKLSGKLTFLQVSFGGNRHAKVMNSPSKNDGSKIFGDVTYFSIFQCNFQIFRAKVKKYIKCLNFIKLLRIFLVSWFDFWQWPFFLKVELPFLGVNKFWEPLTQEKSLCWLLWWMKCRQQSFWKLKDFSGRQHSHRGSRQNRQLGWFDLECWPARCCFCLKMIFMEQLEWLLGNKF